MRLPYQYLPYIPHQRRKELANNHHHLQKRTTASTSVRNVTETNDQQFFAYSFTLDLSSIILCQLYVAKVVLSIKKKLSPFLCYGGSAINVWRKYRLLTRFANAINESNCQKHFQPQMFEPGESHALHHPIFQMKHKCSVNQFTL